MRIAGSSGVWKIGSARAITCAARPLAVGSPPYRSAWPDGFLRRAVLSFGRPCDGRNHWCQACVVQGARFGAVPKTTRARGTRGPAEYRSAELQSEHAPACTAALVASERSGCQNANVRYHQASNLSIERTPKSQLRCLSVAAHVER